MAFENVESLFKNAPPRLPLRVPVPPEVGLRAYRLMLATLALPKERHVRRHHRGRRLPGSRLPRGPGVTAFDAQAAGGLSATLEHCPHCGADLRGAPIPHELRREHRMLCDRTGGPVYRTAGRNCLRWPAMREGSQIRIVTDMRITEVIR
jgi:hypothetical protein